VLVAGKPELHPLSEAELAELGTWLLEHEESLPAPVLAALGQHQALCQGLRGSRHKLSQVLFELRRALGIIPASERRRQSGDPLGPACNGDRARPKSERERLDLDAAHLDKLQAEPEAPEAWSSPAVQSRWHRMVVRQRKPALRLARVELLVLTARPRAALRGTVWRWAPAPSASKCRT
jgi:hypothetical protein